MAKKTLTLISISLKPIMIKVRIIQATTTENNNPIKNRNIQKSITPKNSTIDLYC